MANDNKDLGDFAAITPGTQPDLGEFAKITPNGGKPRSAIGEIGNQLKAGMLVDLPKMAGQAIQYTSDPGRPVYEFGKSIADYAREQEARPDLQPQEYDHNVVTNTLASGARMIPQSIIPAAGVGLIASGAGAGAGAALLAGSVLGAAPAGMAQAEDTLEKARAKGDISEADALSAARKTGLIEWGGETVGNYLGGKMFGLAGRAIGKTTGTAAERALQEATNTQVLKPWMRQLPETIIGEVGTEMGQNAGEAYVEQQAGIDNHAPWDAAKEAILPTIGMTALLAPFGLAGMGVNAHRQQQRNDVLTSPDADQNSRTRIAAEIAPEIEKVDRQAAANFRVNAARAISSNQPLTLDSSLFADPAAAPPAPSAPAAQPAINPADAPDAGTDVVPQNAMTAAASLVQPMLPMRQEGAQKQAEERTRTTGIPHEVVPHPSAAGMFGVRAVQDPALEQGAAPAAEAPPLDPAAPATPAAPVGLQIGETVQATINGEDVFPEGTRITGFSPNGKFVLVEGSTAGIPIENITRLDPAAAAAIELGAHEAATSPQNDRPEPSEAQKHAGNYKKGPAELQGLPLMIENPVGSTRTGTDPDGTPWSTTMSDHYGYIRGTKGSDGKELDIYVGPNPASHHVFVVDQMNQDTGEYDEHKIMLGYNSPEQAQRAYEAHYTQGWQGGENVTATTVDGLKEWLKGDTTQPFNPAYYPDMQIPAGPDLFNTEQAAPPAVTTEAPAAPQQPQDREQIARDTLRELGQISNDHFGGNHPNAIDFGTADGTFAGLGTLNMDEQGNIVLRRFAYNEDHVLKNGKPASLQEMMDASLFSGSTPDAGAVPTSGLASFHDAYSKRAYDAIFRIQPQELVELARQGKAVLGNLSEGEVLLSGDIAGKYLSELNGKPVTPEELQRLTKPAGRMQGAALTEDELNAAFDQAENELAQEQEQPPQGAYERYKEIMTRGGSGTAKLVDEIRRSDELTDAQVQELVGLPKIDKAAEEKSRADSAAFGQRAAEILSTLKSLKTPDAIASAQQTLSTLADDMDAVNDRFRNLVRKAADEIPAWMPHNLGQAGDAERQAANRVKNTLEGVANFGKNVTAPEHAGNEFKEFDPNNRFEPTASPEDAIGEAEIDERVIPLTMDASDFKEVTDEWASLFAAPGQKVITEQRAKQAGVMSQEEAAAQLAKWKEHVAKQAEEHRGENSQRTILSLFDLSGEWSKPWREAGYNVVTFDIQTGQDVNDFSVEYFTDEWDLSDVYGILAAAPCTDFTHAASRLWAVKDADGRTEASKELVLQTLRTIEYFRPKFWALENPSGGRIEKVTGLPSPRLSFQPHHFGNPETKPTALFGKFNPELPLANVAPTGSKTDKVGGKSIETKNERSETPEGFAYAFFMANNYIDQTPEQRLVGDFPELSGAVKGALKAGMDEEAIRDVVTRTYEDGDPDAARNELVQAVADHVKENGAPAKPAGVDYPNRRLGFQKAATDEADAYNDHAWANIAAANMKVGDKFDLGGKQQSVESISDKTLKLKDADGKTRTLNPDGVAWDQFKRDLAGQLVVENLQANNIMKPARPLIDILRRDPAVHVDSKGSVYLRDGGLVPAAQQEEKGAADPHETARRAKLDEEKAEFAWDMVEQASQKLTDDADVARLQPLADEYKGAAAEHRKAKEAALKQLDEKGRKAFDQKQKAREEQDTAEVAKTADAVTAAIEKALGRKLDAGQAAPSDHAKWNQDREDRIAASREAGHTHLDKLEKTVEAMRGKPFYNVHDPKERGVVRSVDLHGNVVVDWNDEYSGEKNLVSKQVEKGKQVWRSVLSPSDLKDYVVGMAKAEQAPAATEEAAKPGKFRAFTEAEKKAIGGISLGTANAVNKELELGIPGIIRPNTVELVRNKLLALDPEAVRPYIDTRAEEHERSWAENHPIVENQKKIHVYDEKDAKPLLIVACADEKLAGNHKAIDLYKGALFDVLRKWMPRDAMDVYILSAKHGLVHADTLIDSYDQKITAARQKELIASGANLDLFKDRNFSEVYIAGSQPYTEVGRVYAEQLRAAGFVGPDARVQATVGFIGQQRGQFGEYLRKVQEAKGTLPANPAPLEVGVRVRIKRLTKAPVAGVSLKDANRFAGRMGTVEREMIVGENRYFIVNLDDTPEKVERQQEFHSGFLDVLTPAEQAAPGELADDVEKRKAQIREQVEATLGADKQLVAQADLVGTGNRFVDFKDSYKAAFERTLAQMAKDGKIEARDVQMFTDSLDKLPGYLDRAARQFINDHHGPDNQELSSLKHKWGYTDENVPKDGRFPDYETALKFDNKRSGKEQFSFEIQVAQGPNGRWVVSSGYQQGGQTGNATGIGMIPPALTSEAHRSRMLAIEAGGEAIRQHLLANGKESPRTIGQILTAITKLKLLDELRDKAAALAARAEAVGAQKLAGQIREVGRDMQPNDVNLTRKRVDETIAGREKLVRAAEKRAEKKAAEKAAKAEPKADPKPEPVAPEAPPAKGDAPGTRRFPKSVRTAIATRLQQVLDGFTADRNTREGRARSIMRSAIEELGKEKTVIDVADQLRDASSDLFKQFKVQADVLDEIAGQLDAAEDQQDPAENQQAPAEDDGALAGSRPMSPKQFETDLKDHGKLRFGEATYEVKPAGRGGFGRIQADTYIVEASYPHSNKVIGFQQNLSLQQAVEAARVDAFDWWDNRRVKEAEFAKKREKLVRAGQRELFGLFSKDPDLMRIAADAGLPVEVDAAARRAIVDWVAAEKAAADLDPDRKLMLDNIVIGGRVTFPSEWFDSLRKYLKRAAKRAEKELDRDPAVYQAELIRSAQLVGLPPESVGVFKLGFDHALAGKTKSTLPPSTMMAQGYDAGAAWMKSDEGQAWFTGRRGKKLENTGADLRRWFDESKRKIKEVTADNLTASYEIIKGQASRVEAFANVAGPGATPGTKRYITAVRDSLRPFQEWLLENGPLQTLYGETGYRESESFRITRFLDGRAYPMTYDATGKRVSMEDATAQERLELLQEAAATYNARLQGLAEAMSGATTVEEAARAYQGYLVKNKDEYVYSSTRLTEAGKEIDRLVRGRVHDLEPDTREVENLIKTQNEPDGPSNRKQALMVPKLDHVVREGEKLQDYRKGENVTPQQMKDTFGFADVGFGKWVGAKQDQDHLNYAYDAFMDLAKLLGIDPKHIGLGGSLHFTIGALGHGRHAAHFQARQPHPNGGTVPVINVTNTKGDGTVAHEWFHALDHALSEQWHGSSWVQHEAVQRVVRLLSTSRDIEFLVKKLPLAVSGQSFMRYGRRNTPIHNLKTEAGLIENAEAVLRYDAGRQGGRPTDYKKNADAMGEDYWGNPKELLARAAEAWVHDTLGGTSNYLVNPAWVGEGKVKAPQYKGAPYPMGEERKLFNDALGALVKALRFNDKGVTLDKETFDKEFPDLDRQFKEAYESLKAQIPSMVRAHLAEKEARKVAQKYAKDEAERAKQAEALAAQKAKEQAERDAAEARLREELEKQQQQPVEPPSGPLSEGDLEALFDQAESELAEEQQEQPEAKDPGEATQADHWTQEDYQHLLQLIDDGQVFLLADPSRGLSIIHDMPGQYTEHKGFGLFHTKTPEYDVTWDGGGEMRQTPGGKSYTLVSIKEGREAFLKAINWDQAKTRLQAKLIVKTGPKAAPTLSAEQEKSAKQLIGEAAKLGVTGIEESLKGLIQLFGGNALKSFPAGFDEESYKAAKPHFEKALAAFQAAGKTLVDLFKMLIQHFGPGIRPYAIQFAKEQGLSANLAPPVSATEKIAKWVEQRLQAKETFGSAPLFKVADEAFGGTQAEGKYSVKDAYDAMEAGMNRHILAQGITPDGAATDAVHKIEELDGWTQRLATQTRRTEEMDEYQQFSTPPSEAFAAAWLANIRPGEVVLEPSAGTGSLAIYAKLAGADVVVNELSSRRAEVLKTVLPEARLFQENAEQLHNILPADVKPSVILMNPPFSATAGRMQGARDTNNGATHIEQALKRLQEGGRLVAIVGSGMAADRPAFKSWWTKIRQDYNVRVNITVDGSNYAKYGTTFDNQILVIDKTGPTTAAVVTGEVKTLAELPALLEGIRNERKAAEGTDGAHPSGQPDADQQGGDRVPAGQEAAGDRAGGADADPVGTGQRDQSDSGGAGLPGHRQDGSAGGRDGEQVGAKAGGEVSDQPGKPGPAGRGANGRGTGGLGNTRGRSGTADRESVPRDGGQQPVTGEVTVEASDQAAATGELSDAIFENYTPQRLMIPGAKPHPGKLVQSAAMSAVLPPSPSYSPNLPKAVIEKGLLSLAQLEAVVYAGQAHQQMLPGGEVRRGFFIGDGTGVGKGREIAGILLDNQRQGRKKAVWLSAKQGLLRDAKRDFAGVSGNPDHILAHNKVKAGEKIDADSGILFTTYDTLRMGSDIKNNAPGLAGPGTMSAEQLKATYPKGTPIEWRGRSGTLESWDTRGHKAKISLPNGVQTTVRFDELKVNGQSGWGGIEHVKNDKKLDSKSRLNQIVEWLGKDFDGVIAFDEAHKMGNVLERKGKRGKTKPSATALAGVALQEALPKARIVYVSATGATEVHNLAYATRLGLWGEGSAFAKVTDFVGGIESGGVAAMELVSRDMKAQGSYLARSLSFDGVTYDRLEHQLTPLQNDIYNELARAWQGVLQNVNAALEATLQNKDPKAKSNALSAFWGNHQRFFSHIITAMQMPTIIEAAQRDLDNGHAVVMQLVNTNQAEQDRQAAKMANDDEAIPEDFDFTPRDTLLNYVRHSFPVQQHEEYTDEEGNKHTRPVVDSKGNPVFNQEMVAKRDALVKNLEQIRVPDNPLDMIVRAFGVSNVAEITGRSRRFIQEQDPKTGGFKVVEQKRPASAVPADADAFMDDKKRVLVFSDAGGTGYSFQSDLGAKNQRRRMHYLVQPGWRANNAVQGFGRTHRSNEANQPHYVLPTTNLKAQKRFISSIARRLDQLGALTKGQRETGGQGLFAATDNLESQHAADAVQAFFVDMYNGTAKLNFAETTAALGLNGLIDESTGALIYGKLPEVPKFLNRLMSLETHRQDEVFEEFFNRLTEVIERAKANGTFDAGMETLRADKVTKLRDEVVYEDKRTGANTRYVELELTHPTHFNSFDQAQSEIVRWGDKFLGFFRNERTGKVFALMRTGTSTDAKSGNVVTRGAQLRTTGGYRYGDEVDKIIKGARGEKTVKKTVVPMLYSPPTNELLTETYTNTNDKQMTVSSHRLADLLIQRGLERVEQTILAGPSGSERDAFIRLLDKMRPHLVAQKETERQVPAFVRLTADAARSEWDAEVAATPTTYTSKTHLLTGMLLPIWDRLPGDPRVVRTQTEDGERLLGRVVSERNLDQTLKNLGVGSNLSKVAPSTVLQRLMDGQRGILANGWLLQKVRVSNDSRIEISGQSLAYNRAERELLTNNGAFVERINWQERVFIPTGEQGVKLLEKLLEYKPLVELGKPAEAQTEDEDAEFSRGRSDTGMSRGDVQNVVAPIVKGWLNAPKVTVVQSVADLPFKAPSDTRGATYQGQVWIVADNLGHAGEVQFVLAHEALGHIGLQALLGKEALTRELNRLRLINPELAKAAREQAATFGYDLNLATEEALADLAGTGKTINGWQKFAALVQKALRQLGLDRVADWMEGKTQAETMSLLARAREAVEGSRAARTFGNMETARFSDGMKSPWFSQLARQIERLPQKSATALQWGETMMGSGFAQKGVKQDEIYWTGVMDWLLMQGENTKVTKAALLDYLAENGVRVTETMHSEEVPEPTPEGLAKRDAVLAKYNERLDDLQERILDSDETPERLALQEEWSNLIDQRNIEADLAYRLPSNRFQRPRYASYTLPGGENNRELLLTLPQREPSFTLDDYIGELSDKYGWEVQGNMRRPGWTEDDLAPDERTRLHALQEESLQEDNERTRNTFQSSHWDQKNVLAHVRFNDRTDSEGKRVLHLEELQSDWGQIGKRDGFKGDPVPPAELDAAAKAARQVLNRNDNLGFDYTIEAMSAIEHHRDWKDRWELDNPSDYAIVDHYRALYEKDQNSRIGVPHAPFVGKTEAWLNLALKRVMVYAAEKGYDRVSFVTGDQAVNRFNLSQQVKAVEIEKAHDEPGYRVNITLLDGEPHETWANDDHDLANLMGKELASKAIDQIKADPFSAARFTGDNLNLGGHGMRTFYDKIVPNAVNNLMKGLGGGRVYEGDVIHKEPYDPKPGTTNYVDEDGRLAYANHGVTGDPDFGANNYYPYKGWSSQPVIDITDTMREKVQGGLPLFSRNVEDTGPLPAARDEASVRLSRATPQQLARQVGDTLKTNTVTKLGRTLSHYRSIGLQFLGRLQLTEIYGKLFPQGDRPNMLQFYSELAAFMDAEKTEGGSKADAIVDRWARLKRADELASLMHDSTRREIDPSEAYVTGDNYTHWKELNARYEALKKAEPEAIKIFHEAAQMYQTHYANVRQAVKDRIDRTLTAHPNRKSLMRRMEQEFFGRGIKGVYFPLARFGDYVVTVRWVGKDPKPGQSVVREAVIFAETLNQAEDERRRLLAEYPASKGYQVMPVTKRAEFNAARDSVSRGFLKKLYAALDDAGLQDPSLQDTINQLYLTSLPDLSWAKSGIHRTGMPGFSQDARRAFAHHMFHGVSYLAKLNYSDRLAEVLEGMQKFANVNAANPDYDHVKAQQVIDEMHKRHDNYMNPKGNQLSTKLTSFGFVWFLGASPASALTNLLQTPTVALPILGGRFGYSKATSALIEASGLAMRGHNDMGKILKGDEKRAWEEWLRIGLVDLTMVHDLVGVASGRDNQLHGNMRKVMKVASFMFHHAERFNRQATALAAYRLARKDGMNHDDAFRASVELTKASHFDYASSNRPRFMQGSAAQVVFLFKQYSQNLIYTFARNAKLAFQGDRQAQKTLAGLLVTHAIAAGIIGLPAVSTLLAAASMLGGSDDDPWDAEVALRRLLADLFGETAGQVLAHGITRPTPFDMSGRVGADHLIFPDIQEGLQGERSFDAFLAGLLGPVVGIGANWARALQQWGRGDSARAIETALPSVAKGPWRSIRYAEEDGAKDRNGIVVADDITGTEHAASWLGFSNGRVREAQEAKAAIYERDQALQRRRQQLMDEYARKRIKHEDVGDQMAAIREFNRAHPNRIIGGLHLAQSVRNRMKHNQQAKQGLYLPAKRAKDARSAGDFADGED
jgi:hypothetical protein